MDTYILHVYRREPESRLLSGLAERVGDGAKQGFRGMDELWTFLLNDQSPAIPFPAKNEPEDSG